MKLMEYNGTIKNLNNFDDNYMFEKKYSLKRTLEIVDINPQ